MTSSERKRPHPWHDNRPFNLGKKGSVNSLEYPLLDFTELTMNADYIHSAELVNTRYPRQSVRFAFQGERGDFTRG